MCFKYVVVALENSVETVFTNSNGTSFPETGIVESKLDKRPIESSKSPMVAEPLLSRGQYKSLLDFLVGIGEKSFRID